MDKAIGEEEEEQVEDEEGEKEGLTSAWRLLFIKRFYTKSIRSIKLFQ